MQVETVNPDIQLRAAVSSDNHAVATLSFGALPDFTYEMPLRLQSGLEQDAKTLRDAVSARPQAFEYRVRLAAGQPSTTYPGRLQDVISGATSGDPLPVVAVVSLLRQFLFAPPPLDLTSLAALAAESELSVESRELRIGDQRQNVYVFRCPELLHAIEKAFQANHYGDAISTLRKLGSGWSDAADRRLQVPGDDERGPDLAWLLWEVTTQLPNLVPPFHFSKAELEATPSSAAVRARLAAARDAEIELLLDSTIKKGPGGRVRYPGYDPEMVLRSIYLHLDADFLLRHVSDEAWTRLSERASALAELCKSQLCRS